MPAPLTRAELTEQARSLVVQPWSLKRPWIYAAVDVGLAAYAALLWATGYPPSRVLVVAAVLVVWIVLHGVELRSRSRLAREEVARKAEWTEWAMLATGFVVVAVTGGLRSPILPGAVAAMPLRLFQYGWTRGTKLHWATTALGVGGAALLGAEWSGPGIGGVLYWTIAAGTLLVVVAATVLYAALLTRVAHASVREATRARDELTLQAIARARDLEQLGAQLSHELKNPLSAIKTLVQLSTRAVQDAESRERLEVVESEIRRMQQILQDHLSFSRPLEKLRGEEVQLASVVDDVLALLAGRAAEGGVTLRSRGDAAVIADPLRLKEALLNLLVNALEASPSGSRVEVDVVEERGSARITVRDHGAGMPEEVLARIGTPFFTTREEGTGLGVALARATFVRHGGALEYASTPGEGTTATATLPALEMRRSHGARARGG